MTPTPPPHGFPPVPEFYGAQPGLPVGAPPNTAGWPPAQPQTGAVGNPLMEALMSLLRHFNMGVAPANKPFTHDVLPPQPQQGATRQP